MLSILVSLNAYSSIVWSFDFLISISTLWRIWQLSNEKGPINIFSSITKSSIKCYEFAIQSSATSIGDNSLFKCSSLTQITILSFVTSITKSSLKKGFRDLEKVELFDLTFGLRNIKIEN